jgi:RNA polymerase sigma-70 factor, ECF subfamily
MYPTSIETRRHAAPPAPDSLADPERQRQLMAAVAAGHGTAAFVALFNYFAPRLKAYMKKLGASDTLAEELAQDVMVTVWRKAGFYDPQKSAVSSWIFTIARNQRIDALRREQRRILDPNEPLLTPLALPLPDAGIEAVERDHRIRAALGTLPSEQAAVVGLAFFAGKSHAEIAESLAIPLGTVKSRMRLAFRHIREALGDGDIRDAA